MRNFCIETGREREKKNSVEKITFSTNGAHKKQKWIDVKGILAVRFLIPMRPVDGTSIDNTQRNARDNCFQVSVEFVF